MAVDDVGKKEREEKNKDDGDKNKANRRPLKRGLWISTGTIGLQCLNLKLFLLSLARILWFVPFSNTCNWGIRMQINDRRDLNYITYTMFQGLI